MFIYIHLAIILISIASIVVSTIGIRIAKKQSKRIDELNKENNTKNKHKPNIVQWDNSINDIISKSE